MGYGMVCAHVCSFLCADTFGLAQEMEPWKNSVSMSFAMVPCAAFCCIIFAFMSGGFRKLVSGRDGLIDHGEHAWIHQCEHSEHEFIAFSVGLVLTQAFRFAIMGDIPHFHGLQKNDDLNDIWAMFFLGVSFAILAFLLSMTLKSMASAISKRAMQLSIMSSSFTSSWCLLFWGKWLFWYIQPDGIEPVTALMEMTTGFVAGCLFLNILLEKLRERFEHLTNSFHAVRETLAFLVGLSWEGLFYTAIVQYAAAHSKNAEELAWHDASMATVLVLVILPGWFMHILPKTIHDHHEEEHQQQEGHQQEDMTSHLADKTEDQQEVEAKKGESAEVKEETGAAA